ncbi:hypothetical protein ACP70R_039437 [Stipagrostis hirtigluma subsp. patula]
MSESDEERPSCRCSKSRCLQCHCRCFSSRYYCSDNCKCLGCKNTEANEFLVEEEVELILKRNPDAFGPKAAVVEEATQLLSVVQDPRQVFAQRSDAVQAAERLSHFNECSCQEIKCSDMNCECFKLMVGCTGKCKCKGCTNSFGMKGGDLIIKPEQTNTSSVISAAIQMENRTQSEDTLISCPNKRPRIWPSDQHDTSPP